MRKIDWNNHGRNILRDWDVCGVHSVGGCSFRSVLKRNSYFEIELGPTLRNMIVGDDQTVLVASMEGLQSLIAVFFHREEVLSAVCHTCHTSFDVNNRDLNDHDANSQNKDVGNE